MKLKTNLNKAPVFDDYISDLSESCFTISLYYISSTSSLTSCMHVGNDQVDDITRYLVKPKTELQRYIHLSRKGMI
jgi:hypothetical protein